MSECRFYSPDRAGQQVSYDSINCNGFKPTHLDMAIEWHKRSVVFADLYKKGEPVDESKRLLLQRFTSNFWAVNIPAMAIIADHYCDNPKMQIPMAGCRVRETYVNGILRYPKNSVTVNQEARRFIDEVDFKRPITVSSYGTIVPYRSKKIAVASPWNNLISFRQMEFSEKIHPTDLDLVMDYDGRAAVFGELKFKDKPLTTGQALLLTRFSHWFSLMGVPTLSFVAEHDIEDPNQVVDFGKCKVRTYWVKGYQYSELTGRTVNELIKNILYRVDDGSISEFKCKPPEKDVWLGGAGCRVAQ